MKKKLKILWSSVTPTIESGYGRVTNEVCKRLIARGYDVINHGYQTAGREHKVDDTFTMLESGGQPYGFNVLKKYFKKYDRDIMITLFDVWPFFGTIEKLDIPWIPYVPIDAEPVTTPIIEPLKYALKIISFSEFGKKQLDKEQLNNSIIYHGVDTKVYKPLTDEEKKAFRKKIGIPEDAFVVGTNGANNFDRKDFPRMIRIFSEFVKRNNAKDAIFYIHTDPNGEAGRSYSMVELGKLYGVKDQLRYPPYRPFSDEMMSKMYNTLDVYFTASRAEGCGMPILEAQACGVPCIVPDNSAQPEWVDRRWGWVVPCTDHIVTLTTPMHNRWYLMDIEEGIKALTAAYEHREYTKAYGKESCKFIQKFDWDKIVDEQWVPFLEKVEQELYGGLIEVWAGGHVYNCRKDKIDRAVVFEGVIHKGYSQHITAEANDNWMDIGGHIGTFSIDTAEKVKQIYTFEPVKENFELLNKNIEQNDIKNILTFNKAIVGNDDTERTFYLDNAGNSGGHSLIGAEKASETKVQCANIDKTIQEFGINKIKLDCEGAEYEILKAMDMKPIEEMIMEWHFNLLGLVKYQEIMDLLTKEFDEVRGPQVINPIGQTIIHCKRFKKVDGA